MSRPTPGGELAGGYRPNLGDRPGARPTPGIQPGGGDRPGLGPGADRPSLGNVTRPSTRPAPDRPTIGGTRPGGDRPIIGGGTRPGRPGGDINIGNDVNIGGGNVIGNRPNWDRPDWNRPDWGWGSGGWAGHWHDHCIHNHYGWYNGCWTGYWGSHWYMPLAWGAAGWGLGTLTSGWGYGTAYYNPYYVAADSVPYDYSQPVAVTDYAPDTPPDAAAQTPPPEPEPPAAVKVFDEGLALFKSGDYRTALARFDAALAQLPGDPVVHEVRALALFALGDYKSAAASLNSFLASAPGMDWTTMSSLYGNVADYEAQLRKLEAYCRSNPNDPSSAFVLAYQYLVLGDKDDAVKALEVVVRNEPKDSTARRMLDALAPSSQTPPQTPPQPAPAAAPAGGEAPTTDLVGNWRAAAEGTTIDLAITDGSQFTWKAAQAGKPPIELAGRLSTSGDELVLESDKQGAMSGSVTSLGPDKWRFALDGAPASDPGLTFARRP